MPGMNSGLSPSDPTLVAAFRSALLHQGAIALLMLVFLGLLWATVRTWRPAASAGTGMNVGTGFTTSSATAEPAVAAIASKTIKISGTLGSFMVPAAAKVAENTAGGQSIVIVFGEVTPADVVWVVTAISGERDAVIVLIAERLSR